MEDELLAGRAEPEFAAPLDATSPSFTRGAPPIPTCRAPSPTTTPSRRSASSPICADGACAPGARGPLCRARARDASTKRALVHGDVSPKNILIGALGAIFLDAECAWFGDPAFDLAFCLNHLLLKGAREGAGKARYAAAFSAMALAYLARVNWEKPDDLEARAAALLAGLFLARVDGKSPVEYLTCESQREAVRRFARPLIAAPPSRLTDVANAWSGLA